MKRCLLLLLAVASPLVAQVPPPVRIGSKKFTESVILGEMAAYLVRDAGGRAIHRRELGSTQILWESLLNGDIDLYPEYVGTLRTSLLKDEPDLEAALARRGLRMSRSLGFNNSYALGMRAEEARRRGIRTISDLIKHQDLRFGFTEEFKNRPDCWEPLKAAYGLTVPASQVRTLDHDLAYRGLVHGDLDVTDLYTTDGQIRTLGLVVLRDDLEFFPSYEALWLYRADLTPSMLVSLLRLEGKISEAEMIDMNARAEQKRTRETHLAAQFLREKLGLDVQVVEESPVTYLLRLTGEHLVLVLGSLSAAVLVAVPLGIVAVRRRRLGQIILAVVGLFQTIPSLALLAFLIPLLHIGVLPALVALFLYSLLPIMRNTYAGLKEVPAALRESAAALGLPPRAVLWRIELPLASRTILAGIKTAAVINVGTATLGALIGAGGYGQPVFEGIRLNDPALTLQGAVPAALMALLVLGLFELAERTLTPRGLRVATAG